MSDIYNGCAITAVHMDTTKTIMKNPTTAVAYFGTVSGELYRSIDGMQTWQLLHTFPNSIVEVMSSNEDYNKIAVTDSYGVWVSYDNGDSWELSWSL